MATAQVLATKAHSVSTIPSVSHSGSRKRKQKMPPPASHTNDVTSPSGAVNLEPIQTTLLDSLDKNLSATIEAVVVLYDYPKQLVKSCVLDMVKHGKPVTCETLLEYIELNHHLVESYNESSATARDSGFSEAKTYTPSSLELFGSSSKDTLSAYVAPVLNYPCDTSPTAVSSLQSANNYHNNSQTVFEQRPNRSLGGSSHENTTGTGLLAPEIKNTLDIEEDVVDGSFQSSVGKVNDSTNARRLNGSAASASYVKSKEYFSQQGATPKITKNSLSKSNNYLPLASLVTSQPKSLDFNQTGQTCETLGKTQADGSAVDETTSSALLSNVETHSKDATANKRSESENISEPGTSSQERTPNSGESNQRKPLVEGDARFVHTCARLVEREHSLLEKSRICSLCKVKPRDVTFLPCGHFSVCRGCAEPIYECPSCNKSILATVDTYLS